MGAAAASRDMQGETADTLYLFGSWTTTPAHRQMPGRGLAVKRHAEPAPRWDTAARLRNKASARRSRTAAMLGRAGMGCGGRATLPRLQGRSNHIPQSCFLDVADSICPGQTAPTTAGFSASRNGSSLPVLQPLPTTTHFAPLRPLSLYPERWHYLWGVVLQSSVVWDWWSIFLSLSCTESPTDPTSPAR